ncbi:hypothetical protein L7F22_003416 [Adiantum nelumboides]|nr:hypothetical protein [Adiantum nelumboides]
MGGNISYFLKQVYGFRASLWAEHLRVEEDCFERPWSQECVKKVRSIAKENWERYADEQVTNMVGHLMLYPLDVEASGKVVPIPGYDTFPDVGGKIIGTPTNLPDSLTT